jgi:hypothetical protein
MKNKQLIVFLLLLTVWQLRAQDTVKVMHYNLLNYGNTTTYCTQTNNNINDKAAAMAIVMTWAQPDILTVNEVGANSFAFSHFLNNVLNINGVTYYQSSSLTNLSSSDLANFIFYDSRKFVLDSQHAIATDIRDINIFRLYHNDPNLQFHQDTAILYVISTHLKAGTSSSDAAQRAAMAKLIMDSAGIWSGFPAILTGDLNLYTANEQAWKNLTAPADTTGEVFYDPVNMSGAWQDNPLFASIHTQSTRASSNGCAAGGGLDDRFDFILFNKKLKNQPQFFSYIPGSYRVIGNDGNHLNQSINAGTNTSAPTLIINALFNSSDHLPVMMDLLLEPSTQGLKPQPGNQLLTGIKVVNGAIELHYAEPVSLASVAMFDLAGRLVNQWSNFTSAGEKRHLCTVPASLTPGFYLVRAVDTDLRVSSGKLFLK